MSTIIFLVKFFQEERYAADFVAGKIFCNTLRTFKQMKGVGSEGRADKNEGTTAWLQPGLVQAELNGMDISGDLAGPLQAQMDWLNDLYVFCMFAGHTGDLDPSNLSTHNLGELRDEISIPNECLQFGEYGVAVTNVTKFIERMQTAARVANYKFHRGLVKYYDPETFHGSFRGIEAVFRKQLHHNYQREYRFAIGTGSGSEEPVILEIGDISDITFSFDATDIRREDFLVIRTKDRP